MKTTLLTRWSWPSSLRNCENIHFHCWNQPVCGTSIWQCYPTNTKPKSFQWPLMTCMILFPIPSLRLFLTLFLLSHATPAILFLSLSGILLLWGLCPSCSCFLDYPSPKYEWLIPSPLSSLCSDGTLGDVYSEDPVWKFNLFSLLCPIFTASLSCSVSFWLYNLLICYVCYYARDFLFSLRFIFHPYPPCSVPWEAAIYGQFQQIFPALWLLAEFSQQGTIKRWGMGKREFRVPISPFLCQRRLDWSAQCPQAKQTTDLTRVLEKQGVEGLDFQRP